jgi:uncharacterized protein (UPF0303 family)
MGFELSELPTLEELLEHEARLRFSPSDLDPVRLGEFIYREIKSASLPLCLIIRMYGRTVFQISAPGSEQINDLWMLRKARVSEDFGHSSLYVRLEHIETGRPYESHAINLDNYAFFGGGFPLKDEVGRTFGAVGISGTLQIEEHFFLVSTLSKFKNS